LQLFFFFCLFFSKIIFFPKQPHNYCYNLCLLISTLKIPFTVLLPRYNPHSFFIYSLFFNYKFHFLFFFPKMNNKKTPKFLKIFTFSNPLSQQDQFIKFYPHISNYNIITITSLLTPSCLLTRSFRKISQKKTRSS